MDFHDGAVQGDRLDLDAHNLFSLELCEHSIEDAALRPPIHPSVDGVPVAESLGQAAPFAAVLGHVEDGIENLGSSGSRVGNLSS